MYKLKRIFVLSACLLMTLPSAAVAHPPDESSHIWHMNNTATFYGPGFYGKETACGQVMTPESQWVAVSESRRKEFPCGTHIRFEWQGTQIVVQVLDVCPGCRGDHLWDLSSGTCYYLAQHSGHERCNTNPIAWTR